MSTVSKDFFIKTIYDNHEKEAVNIKKETARDDENVIVSSSETNRGRTLKKKGRQKKKGKAKKPPKKYNSCEICGNDKVSETQTVQCDFCKYKSCKSCLKYYITHNPEPRCMKCDELLSEEFIYLKIMIRVRVTL